MHLELEVDEKIEIFVLLLGILLHQLRKRLALDIVGHYCPFAVDDRNLENSRNIESGLFDTCLVERLVEHVGL